jgi:hypothetical protein
MRLVLQNIVVEESTIQLRNREVLGANHRQETGYPD